MVCFPALCLAEVCTLQVSVMNEEGLALGVPIHVIDSDGTMYETRSIKGTAEFCALPVGPAVVTVGAKNGCNLVTVSKVNVSFLNPVRLSVVLNSCHDGGLLPNPCAYVLRAVGRDGKFLPNSVLEVAHHRRTSDRFGRFLVLVSMGETRRLTVSNPVAGRKEVSLQCDKVSQEREIRVILDYK
jgi:hypothetical protein